MATNQSKVVNPNSRELLEKAIVNKHPLILFLDKYGEQVTITLAPSDPESDALRLIEHMWQPGFQICTAIDGLLTDRDGYPRTIEELPELIEQADDERNWFYTEKEKEFGESAWPHKFAE